MQTMKCRFVKYSDTLKKTNRPDMPDTLTNTVSEQISKVVKNIDTFLFYFTNSGIFEDLHMAVKAL